MCQWPWSGSLPAKALEQRSRVCRRPWCGPEGFSHCCQGGAGVASHAFLSSLLLLPATVLCHRKTWYRPVRGTVELSGMTALAFSSCWQTDQTHRSLREKTSYPMPDCLLTVQEAVWFQVHWKYTDLQAKPPLPEGKGTVEHLAPPSRPGPCCSQEG